MLKALGVFVVGFVGTILVLNAIIWIFGQAVGAIVAWVIAAVSLVVIVVCMTIQDKPMSAAEAKSLKDYWQKTQ